MLDGAVGDRLGCKDGMAWDGGMAWGRWHERGHSCRLEYTIFQISLFCLGSLVYSPDWGGRSTPVTMFSRAGALAGALPAR